MIETTGAIIYTIELSSNSTWLLVGSWLFCLQNLPCLVSFLCMPGGSVEVWTKNILYRFMEGQTLFSTSWHAKMSLTLHEPIQNVLSQTSTLPPRMHHKLTKHEIFCKQNNQPPTKRHVELEDTSNEPKISCKYSACSKPVGVCHTSKSSSEFGCRDLQAFLKGSKTWSSMSVNYQGLRHSTWTSVNLIKLHQSNGEAIVLFCRPLHAHEDKFACNSNCFKSMVGENRQLVINEPVEFEK